MLPCDNVFIPVNILYGWQTMLDLSMYENMPVTASTAKAID